MVILLLPLSMLMWLLNASFGNRFGKAMMRNISDSLLYNIFCLLTSAILLAALMRPYVLPSPYTLFLGVLFGIITISGQLSATLALARGPMSITMLIASCAMLIPAVSGAVFWNESIGIFQLAGLFLMVVSLFLCTYIKSNEKQKKANFLWLILSFIAFLSSGIIGVLQKIHQSSIHKNELDIFLVTAFFTASLLLTVIFLIQKPKNNYKKFSLMLRPSFFVMSALAGLAIGGMNKINMYLSGVLPSILFFPVYNGGCVLLSAVTSVVVFKEKLTLTQKFGLLSGALAIALLGNIADMIFK